MVQPVILSLDITRKIEHKITYNEATVREIYTCIFVELVYLSVPML